CRVRPVLCTYYANTLSSSTGPLLLPFFFFDDTATPVIYTLSLHDALPICDHRAAGRESGGCLAGQHGGREIPRRDKRRNPGRFADRKSTRLNSSHVKISYAVFCLKKKKE